MDENYNVAPNPTRNTAARSSSVKRGRPLGDRDGRRRELLRAAIAILAESGFAGTSLRKVAQRAGFTTGAVTYYFANKEAMVVAVIEHLWDEYDSLLEMGSSLEALKRRLSAWIAMNVESDIVEAQFQLLAQAKCEPLLAKIYQRRYAHYRKRLTENILGQQQSGRIRQDIPADLLADHISAMADGWSMMLHVEPKRFEPQRLNALFDGLTRLLEPHPAED
ncbi:TetR/AcrR family transcriptional regulator [Sphingorhabdus sp.]|jgi:AcrR family transcriptional regulator|uniref:TetR/AcrR family transcriptional regulator n=1 Tax=Sphingorhabdus sp. TaxID=1902408 RepID=UPI0011D5FB04|nr:TetR/AcrR family transcriptional regulator [Sphingorhabdus sp.]TXH12842.1 MAG: TetR/AcrR family transcriptional regulator [Gammaproteobacteria bacterium]HMT42258.1 TetR/AcrR family transcriptional regulator [Sphingorhabdus sp.]